MRVEHAQTTFTIYVLFRWKIYETEPNQKEIVFCLRNPNWNIIPKKLFSFEQHCILVHNYNKIIIEEKLFDYYFLLKFGSRHAPILLHSTLSIGHSFHFL